MKRLGVRSLILAVLQLSILLSCGIKRAPSPLLEQSPERFDEEVRLRNPTPSPAPTPSSLPKSVLH